MWQWVARGNIQQISYIPQTEQHSPFGLMLLRLGNVTVICMYVCMYVCMYKFKPHIASFPGSCAWEEERELGTHCSRMRQVPLVTCILLRYTKITVNFCLPAESRSAWLYSLWGTDKRF